MSKKNLLAAAVLAFSSMSAMAGGLLTNTNQNAAYVRMMSQGAIIDITGLYANPAGTAFLSNGWHLSLNSQSAWQQRNIETSFMPMAYNVATPGNPVHLYEGKAKAPVIPSFQLSYNKDKWSVNANFALVGGGGKCDFATGLGTFEGAYSALIPSVAGGMIAKMQLGGMLPADAQYAGYSMNSNLKGTSYQFGLTLGGTYKFLENLSGFVGLRFVYATASYDGLVDPTAYVAVPSLGLKNPTALSAYGINLDCDQNGFGVTPVIGLNWKINNHWNVAAKYEAPTKMELTNTSTVTAADGNALNPLVSANAGALIGKFEDGKKVRDDVPSILAVGAMYSPIEEVRINAGMNYYFDKQVTKTGLVGGALVNDKGLGLDKNTWELNAGVEYDVCKWLTISASYQNTNYGISNEGMSDLSFNLSNSMVGAGLRIKACEMVNIDLGYMHTFYQDRDVKTANFMGSGMDKTDNYVRKNDVFGIGVNLHF